MSPGQFIWKLCQTSPQRHFWLPSTGLLPGEDHHLKYILTMDPTLLVYKLSFNNLLMLSVPPWKLNKLSPTGQVKEMFPSASLLPWPPYFRGLWEAAVKSMKLLLCKVLGDRVLTYEELTTVMTDAEAILNSRLLVPIDTPTEDGVAPLTPGHFLDL